MLSNFINAAAALVYINNGLTTTYAANMLQNLTEHVGQQSNSHIHSQAMIV